MLIAFDRQCLIVLFTKPMAVELSTCIGVGGCGCPISSRAIRRGTASFAVKNMAPTSASIAELMTLFIIFASTWITPLGVGGYAGASLGFLGLLLRKKMALARLRALVSER